MRSNPKLVFAVVVNAALALYAAEALAQTPPPPPPAGPLAPAGAPADEDKDGMRFRGGVSIVAGTMLLNNYSGFLAGVDGRVGLQINDLIGAYVVPHLTFGPVKAGGLSSVIGLFSATGVADVTLMDQIFVGAGGGFGVVNNPSGPVVHLRAGGYPLMGTGENGIRRKGLMIGADMRLYVLSLGTVMEIMGGIGYEAF